MSGASVPGRLEFRREPVVDRRSRRFRVHERVFRMQPRQVGTFRPTQRLADTMVHGIRSALTDLLEDEVIDDRDYVSLSSDRLNNVFDFMGLLAGEWRQNGVRAAEMLDRMSRLLNSNEQFETNDSLQLAFVHVRRPPVGTGRKKYMPGHQSSQRLKEINQSCVRMPQDDAQLCAMRAIMKAHGLHQAGSNRNERLKWTSPRQCVRRCDRAARALLGEVGLHPGPYGPDQLTLMATAPSLYD